MPKYEVQIIYKGSDIYIVEATDEDDALDIATAKFRNGVKADIPGAEDIENINAEAVT